jgi:hypothetical protein
VNTIINVKTTAPPAQNYVFVGRDPARPRECFGNPFTHLKSPTRAQVLVPTRADAIQAFDDWLSGIDHAHVAPDQRDWILANLMTLQGKTLGCYCYPEPCHAEILIKRMNIELDELIRGEALERDYDIDETLRHEAEHNTEAWKRGEL